MLKSLCVAIAYHETGVQTSVFVRALEPEQISGIKFVGQMFAYTLKDKGKDTYSNVQGGTDWSDERTREWVREMEDRINANVNSTGFIKSAFSIANRRNAVKVNSMNIIPLVIAFTHRDRFDHFQASFVRRFSWMLMSGHYKLSASMTTAAVVSSTCRSSTCSRTARASSCTRSRRRARTARNPANPPLDALVKELDLEAYAHAKGCRLHGARLPSARCPS